ncbi:hypothetical protein PR202_ga07963 [Eleusine coracana subsp. coracana]|uniref:Uncharacterized protein n=1 Tax=Eleusine coracana subsp. coracana TaxID=191504 RepID=A0AAV5C1H6_ELECO|nr:hypothetical protein QOZ80_2AG0118340 [Eleusine coracana subsp. coracana]GJM91578.1 hypothetical protein PR202_ga07963 [Eleusine coracana subsp. coracana]
METPLSNRRITRSLAAAAAAASSAQKSAADHFTRSKNAGAGESRAVLHDITNDSPIVGLAAGGLHDKTPAATGTKTRPRPRRTPGSGEALLRGQVKALLHKVHEEQGSAAAAALARPPARIQALLGVARSPAQLLAPTPANTPQIGAASAAAAREGLLLPDVMPCVLEEEGSLIPKLQVIAASLPPSPMEENLSEGQLHRALVFDDSPGKSDSSNGSSSLKYDSSSGSNMDKPSSSTEDDSSSIWSIQVHASSEKGDEDLGEDLGEYTEEEDWEEGSDDDECFDDLCEEMSKMIVFYEVEEKAGLPQFEGKHTRFIYNSDDEIDREEVAPSAEARAELGALLLRGLPVPEGRHLRFHEDDEEDED